MVLTLPPPADAGTSPGLKLSGWAVNWDPPAALAQLESHLARIDTVWSRTLQLTAGGALEPVVTPGLTDLAKKLQAAGKAAGPVLDNAANGGFSRDLALALFAHAPAEITRLTAMARAGHWRAFNVDLEALEAQDADAFEGFVRQLRASLAPLGVRLSVAVHAKTDGTGSGISAFQRWPALAKLGVDLVIMAYDHAWSTSPPGLVAPLGWIKAVLAYARTQIPPEHLILALPLYGYHWTKDATGAWHGDGRRTPELRALVAGPGFQADKKVAAADGYLFQRGNLEAVAFDDDASLLAKAHALGIDRLAVWRFGGEDGRLYLPAGAP
jgi:spore germination protein YaaH